MFAILTSIQDPRTQTVFYGSLSGYTWPAPFQAGSEENSTVLRGFLLAAIASLKRITELYGEEAPHRVDILCPDPVIVKLLAEKTCVNRILRGDNDDLWEELFRRKTPFDVRFVSSPAETEHLSTVWNFACVPMIPGALKPMASAPQKVAAETYVPGKHETVGMIRWKDLL